MFFDCLRLECAFFVSCGGEFTKAPSVADLIVLVLFVFLLGIIWLLQYKTKELSMKKGAVMLILAFSIGYAQQLPFVGVKYFNSCGLDCGKAGEREITISKNGIVTIKTVPTNFQVREGGVPDVLYKGTFSNPLFVGNAADCDGDTYVFKKNKIFCTRGGIIRKDSPVSKLY